MTLAAFLRKMSLHAFAGPWVGLRYHSNAPWSHREFRVRASEREHGSDMRVSPLVHRAGGVPRLRLRQLNEPDVQIGTLFEPENSYGNVKLRKLERAALQASPRNAPSPSSVGQAAAIEGLIGRVPCAGAPASRRNSEGYLLYRLFGFIG
jgi:hypothetical protein